MKILLITDRLNPGGAETHCLQLAHGLSLLGAQVTLASGGGALTQQCAELGIRHIQLPLPTHSPLRLLRLRRSIRKLARREHFDIVHAHARIPALLIRGCRRYGAAEIVTVHARFYVNPILSRICYWGMHTVAVSEDLSRYVCRSYNIPPTRVTVIPNGIDCNRFTPAPNTQHPNSIRILFASRLDADCALGAELLCTLAPSLCEKSPTLRITVAGGGSEYSRIRKLAHTANQKIGHKAITAVGHVTDMPALLQKQDIFIGVSRAAMEAAACGCAVILCGNEGYFGILDRTSSETASKTNFCARGCPLPDLHSLGSDLSALIEDPARRHRSAREGHEWVITHCNADAMCRKTLQVYQSALLQSRQKRLLIGGYFGSGNLGDDAILTALLEELTHKYPQLRPTVLTGRPTKDQRRFGVSCVGRMNPVSILFAILKSDALLLGGGSLLQNATSNRSLCYYLALLRLSQALGKPTVLCGAGIGPLIDEPACRKVRAVLSKCLYISLRDEGSRNLLISLGVDAAKLHMGADLAMLLSPPSPSRTRALLSEVGLPPTANGFLCVVLKGGKNEHRHRKILTAAVRSVCQSNGIQPVFAVFDSRSDRSDTATAARSAGGQTVQCPTPAHALALLSRARAVVTMRLHAMILATAAGTPAMGLSGDPRDRKINAFANASGQDQLEKGDWNVPTLNDRLQALLNRPQSDTVLREITEELQKKAQKDLANIAEMIYNIDSKA